MSAPARLELPGGASGPVQPTSAKGLHLYDRLVSLDSERAAPAATTSDSLIRHSTIRTSPPVAPRCGITTGCFMPASCSARPLLPNSTHHPSDLGRHARRPATSTSLSRPEPMDSYGFASSGTARPLRSASKYACLSRLPTLILRTPSRSPPADRSRDRSCAVKNKRHRQSGKRAESIRSSAQGAAREGASGRY